MSGQWHWGSWNSRSPTWRGGTFEHSSPGTCQTKVIWNRLCSYGWRDWKSIWPVCHEEGHNGSMELGKRKSFSILNMEKFCSRTQKRYHSEPLGFPQSQELGENDAHHSEHKGELVYELHLQKTDSFKHSELLVTWHCHLRNPLYVISYPRVRTSRDSLPPGSLTLLLRCTKPGVIPRYTKIEPSQRLETLTIPKPDCMQC